MSLGGANQYALMKSDRRFPLGGRHLEQPYDRGLRQKPISGIFKDTLCYVNRTCCFICSSLAKGTNVNTD